MPCKYCITKPVIQLTSSNLKLCKTCFSRYFEKKVYKTIRTYNMIENSKNLFIEKGRFSELNFYLLNKLSEERKGKFKVSKKTVKGSKILKSENLDKISYLILFNEFKNKIKKDLLPVYKNEIRPFYFCSDKEIETYCKIKQIKINKEKPQKDNIMKFINEVEDKYSGTKINIAKSYLDIVNALN